MNKNIPPDIFNHLEDVRSEILNRRVGLLLDFDGTISEITSRPEDAVIHPATVEPIRSLSNKLSVVVVVSGRAASVIQEKVGIETVVYVGNHGAETIVNGKVTVESESEGYREKLKALLDHLRDHADGPGLIWEDKGFSTSVHYRMAQDSASAEDRLRKSLSSAPYVDELEIFWGRMVLEMRAPTGVNKGFALRKLVKNWNLDTVIFVGDDTTDRDAMLALTALRSESKIKGVNALVLHENSSDELLEAADYSIENVTRAGEFLKWLNEVSS